MKKGLLIGLGLVLTTAVIILMIGPNNVINKITGKSQNDTASVSEPTPSIPKHMTELEKSLLDVPFLEPVSAETFGDYGILKSQPNELIIQNPTDVSKVGDKVDVSQI